MANEYIVLRKDAHSGDQGASWTDFATVDATSATQAVRKALVAGGSTSGTYVAIPARSFKPVTVKAEVVTTLKLEEAT